MLFVFENKDLDAVSPKSISHLSMVISCSQIKVTLASSVSENDLIAQVEQLNSDDSIDGILVQLPLPEHCNEAKVLHTISAEKGRSVRRVGGGVEDAQQHFTEDQIGGLLNLLLFRSVCSLMVELDRC